MKNYLWLWSSLLLFCVQIWPIEAMGQDRPLIIQLEVPQYEKDFFIKIRGDVNGSGASDFVIDWGDGTTTKGGSMGIDSLGHSYAHVGNYTVKVKGKVPHLSFISVQPYSYEEGLLLKPNAEKVTELTQWGDNRWYSMSSMFSYAKDLKIKATDQPDLSHVETIGKMFYQAINFEGDLSLWNVSNVKCMESAFYKAVYFTSDLSAWDVENVTDFSRMFAHSYDFDSDLSHWNVSNAKDISYMFTWCKLFESDLSQWDVSNVTTMNGVFSHNLGFTSDLSQWDISNVTSMQSMFYFAKHFTSATPPKFSMIFS
ncbi:BspA family leucine-rich repeat surface protein [Persicobacter psychrovividus]|uniref:Surface protein n=1 Tax=Persicobacter psychrovividus TaxID=387638 RepID=A0ABM7VIF0_9BACT|nr:hypothetical protein PEPS_30420 [Persicobacter psychrovividus]